MRKSKRRMNCITISQDVDVDIYVRDIIGSLSDFDTDELEDLREAIDKEIGESDKVGTFNSSNLEDEQKVKILKEMFYKYSWKELEKINRSISL